MMRFIKTWLVTLPLFLTIDIIWLGVVAKPFYRQQIGFLMRLHTDWTAAVIFYLLFNAGIVFFVVMPAQKSHSAKKALMSGALFGLITYATYDLTNLATLQHWPLAMVLVDMAWGTALCALVSVLSFWLSPARKSVSGSEGTPG